MRRKNKQQIKSLLGMVESALDLMIHGHMEYGTVLQLNQDCSAALEAICNLLNREHEQEQNICGKIDICIEGLQQNSVNGKKENLISVAAKINELMQGIESLPDDKLKVLFLPYKYSMWDSMRTIWEAAKNDERCECHLVPIPYFERNAQGQVEKACYEREDYPSEAEDYRDFNMEQECPDIIYFHNPYDDINLVTSVHPRFYSRELKKYTDTLVYVPYYVAGAVSNLEEGASIYRVPGSIHADRIILQSEELKRAYIQSGIEEDKLLVLGSPKIDAVLYPEVTEAQLNLWKGKLGDKKVLLINTSISGLLGISDHLYKMENLLVRLNRFLGIGYIWRPHPLLQATISSMKNTEQETYNRLLSLVEDSENGIVDHRHNLYSAIERSDGLVSDYSSLIMQYLFTGKPVFCMEGTYKKTEYIFCDYFGSYFEEEGVSLEDFALMLEEGKDPKMEERLKRAKKSICNSDGTSGEKIHKAIMKICCRREEQ